MNLDFSKQERREYDLNCPQCNSLWEIDEINSSGANMSAINYGSKVLKKGSGCEFCGTFETFPISWTVEPFGDPLAWVSENNAKEKVIWDTSYVPNSLKGLKE